MANAHLAGEMSEHFNGPDNGLLNFAADISGKANGPGDRVDEDSIFLLTKYI